MPKFLITRKSSNRITGPIMVTTSPRRSCPTACPLRKTSESNSAGGCYAEHGFLGGFIWGKLDKLEPGERFKANQIRVYDLPELLAVIRALPAGTLWRHNQAGDLYSQDQVTIDPNVLFQIVTADTGRMGFTYTHYDVLDHLENRRVVAEANRAGFTINLSANDPTHADQLASLGIAPVATVLPANTANNLLTHSNHQIIICPAQRSGNMTCATCKICAKQRRAIVGLPAIGAGAKRLEGQRQTVLS